MHYSAYTLIKFPVSASRCGWVISSVDLGNVISFNGGDLAHGQIPRERNCQIVSKCEDLATLVLQIVNELRIFTIFTR